MLLVAILVASSFVLSSIPVSNGCTCLFRHPQQVVCESDFVIKGLQVGEREIPLSDDFPPVGGNRVYTILVKTVYKGRKIKAGKTIEVSTGLNSAACGVTVTSGVLWLLTGQTRKVNKKTVHSISLCDWNAECQTLTNQQLAFLEKGPDSYFGKRKRNCKKCKIVTCPQNDCSSVRATTGTCLRDSKQCYGKTLSCQYKSKRCQWRSQTDAETCINS
ncbi:metalloproteinase inhibitor 2-like [Pecten maximus]|uniref:metalloproteinase inhibitor 2-like n=1 Tax=Pecten maximus TaxID=6579 RepID=UPI001458D033|nr:metalloproteinase inhibitor 2-like [Pecten maximus]